MRAPLVTSKGFSLLEVVIAMMFASLILMMTFSQFMPWFQFRQKLETERKMENIQMAIEAAYRANAGLFDDSDSVDAVFGGGVITVGKDASGNDITFQTECPGVTSSNVVTQTRDTEQEKKLYEALKDYMPMSDAGPDAFVDGYGATFCIGISRIKNWDVDGLKIPYRNIVVVSKGMNNEMDLPVSGVSPWDPVNGQYNPISGSDDTVMVVQGINIEQEKYDLAVTRMERLAEAYSAHFLLNYLRNPSRDITLNYFYCAVPITDGVCDPASKTGGVVTGGQGSLDSGKNAAILSDLSSVLGLSQDDFKNPWFEFSSSTGGDYKKAFVMVDNILASACATPPCPSVDRPPYAVQLQMYHPNPNNQDAAILSRTATSRYE
jgi:type II secretory pathway pseudopilin PulG